MWPVQIMQLTLTSSPGQMSNLFTPFLCRKSPHQTTQARQNQTERPWTVNLFQQTPRRGRQVQKQGDSPFTTRAVEVLGGSKQTSRDGTRFLYTFETPPRETAPFRLRCRCHGPAPADAPGRAKMAARWRQFPPPFTSLRSGMRSKVKWQKQKLSTVVVCVVDRNQRRRFLRFPRLTCPEFVSTQLP